MQAVRRDEQAARLVHGFALRQRIEHSVGFLADVVVGGHQAQVGIQPRGLFVVVARADLRVIGDARFLHPRNQAELGVHLVSVQPVDHAAARFFQPTAPLDVVFLVKARLQFDQHQHVLAVFRRLAKRLDDLTLLGDAVQRHLDGNHAVVVGGFRQHFEERLHALESSLSFSRICAKIDRPLTNAGDFCGIRRS